MTLLFSKHTGLHNTIRLSLTSAPPTHAPLATCTFLFFTARELTCEVHASVNDILYNLSPVDLSNSLKSFNNFTTYLTMFCTASGG